MISGRIAANANFGAKNVGPVKVQNIIQGGLTRLNECHTFGWSRDLWRQAGHKITITTMVMGCVYISLVAFGLYFWEGLEGIDIPYFMATTITTVHAPFL